eukprot:TRINITY_DN3027_c1_g1_i1.p1 TRINITY_DN3027_c1_g1~~TRINITY_DN3027_c1_g1_i1.p1  ORF type:complete len:642 (+),score=163.18 TRINITY_DN3027_c1_g1_i1:47-1927(+)
MSLRTILPELVEGKKFDALDEPSKIVLLEGLLSEDTPMTVRASILTLLTQGVTPDQVNFVAKVMQAKAVPCEVEGDVCDIVGTGGDMKNTLNISTPASIIAASMGMRVTKHGGRSASAASGSADVAEHLGGNLMLDSAQVSDVVKSCGYCFIFAPAFQPALKPLVTVRKELGFKTVFNLTGTLLNPTRPRYMILGVGFKDKIETMVAALSKQKNLKCLVVHSTDGMDKISPAVPTHSWMVESDKEPVYTLLKPEDFGLEPHSNEYFSGGGGPIENSAIVLSMLQGTASEEINNFVYVHAAALAYVSGHADTLKSGMELVRKAVSEGKPLECLDNFVRTSTQIAKGKSTDILARILKRRSVDVLYSQQQASFETLEAAAQAAMESHPPISLSERITSHPHSVGVCAELKRASPSEGDISTAPILPLAAAYASANVQVISVLTEPVWFKGTLDDLKNVREEVSSNETRPAVLRKDFIFTKYQVLEARSNGADTLLLIVAASETMKEHGESLKSLIEYSRKWGMEPLVEVVTEEEVDAAVAAGAKVIGINNRDLKTFKVDLNRTGVLIDYANAHHPAQAGNISWIALSGVSTTEHVANLKKQKATAVLVGTSLMRSADPAAMIGAWQKI